jgi:hypothetical protein
MPQAKHAVFATAPSEQGGKCFRIGNPTTLYAAHDRHRRLDSISYRTGVHQRVRHDGRWYAVKFFEVREVDHLGRGLGSERHERAIPVRYSDVKRATKFEARATQGWLTRYIRAMGASRSAKSTLRYI